MILKTNNGYIPESLLIRYKVEKMREFVEYEKFQARMLVDNETTKQFKVNTENHPNKMYKLRFNNMRANKYTVAGKQDATVA
jgi:hypothetical protein